GADVDFGIARFMDFFQKHQLLAGSHYQLGTLLVAGTVLKEACEPNFYELLFPVLILFFPGLQWWNFPHQLAEHGIATAPMGLILIQFGTHIPGKEYVPCRIRYDVEDPIVTRGSELIKVVDRRCVPHVCNPGILTSGTRLAGEIPTRITTQHNIGDHHRCRAGYVVENVAELIQAAKLPLVIIRTDNRIQASQDDLLKLTVTIAGCDELLIAGSRGIQEHIAPFGA